jgi:chloride channel protein, CIC family
VTAEPAPPDKDDDLMRRVRVPPPLIRRRLPSGRGATEQPNVTGEGDTPYSPRFWLAVLVTGVCAGLFGMLMMAILFGFQRLAFGAGPDGLLTQLERTSPLGRVAPLLIAGAIAGPAWYLLRRWTAGERSEVDEVVWSGRGRLSFRRTLLSGVLSEFVIGMGASIGREAAPKALGGVSGDLTGGFLRMSPAHRRLLVACGAGAGLAAVYNVPLGGALFASEVMLGSIALPVVLPAVACSAIATAVSWLYLPQRPAFVAIPDYRFSATIMVFSLVVGPLAGVLASGYIRLIGWVSYHRVEGRPLLVGPLFSFAVLGVIGLAYPALYGNGKDMAYRAFLGIGSASLFSALFALKPFVTALCLGGGAQGGLLTPFMSTGSVLGAFVGVGWTWLWPGSPVGAFALVGSAAMLGAALQAPLTGLVLVVELTNSGLALMVPIMAATFLATAAARHIDGYSIYSARLPRHH